jgi:hypothetical protein
MEIIRPSSPGPTFTAGGLARGRRVGRDEADDEGAGLVIFRLEGVFVAGGIFRGNRIADGLRHFRPHDQGGAINRSRGDGDRLGRKAQGQTEGSEKTKHGPNTVQMHKSSKVVSG